jgi:hypothetical protein
MFLADSMIGKDQNIRTSAARSDTTLTTSAIAHVQLSSLDKIAWPKIPIHDPHLRAIKFGGNLHDG